MKKLFLFVLVLLIICISANASHSASYWAKTYRISSSSFIISIKQTTDGGYIVAGATKNASINPIWILKLDQDGNVSWQKKYDLSNNDVCSIQQTTDGGYIVVGIYNYGPFMYPDMWILKLDQDGNVSWHKTYGGDSWKYSIKQTTDGGYIVAGGTQRGAGSGDMWILKLDQDGNVSWHKIYGGSDQDTAYSIQQTTDGGYIVAGRTQSFGDRHGDMWILKLDPDGTASWQKNYGGSSGSERASSIQQTTDGGYIVAGETFSFGAGEYDFWVLKLDEIGNVSWQKTYGGSDWDHAFSVQQTTDGGYIVAGPTRSFGFEQYNGLILKLDQDGNVSWQKTYDGSVTQSIQQTTDGGYIVMGGGSSVLKLDSKGEIPDCDIIGTSNAIVSDTTVEAQDTNATVQSFSATVTDISVAPQDTSVETTTICSYECEILLAVGETNASPGDKDVPVEVSLDNPYVEVRGIQVDICDVDDYLNCIGCETTERTSEFICSTNELENGCCKVVLVSTKGDLIEMGTGSVFTLKYNVSEDCPSGVCSSLNPENVTVADELNFPLEACTTSGKLCFAESCGDVYPAKDCGDGEVNIFDILEEIDFVLGITEPSACQAEQANVPTSLPPDCVDPDDDINLFDVLVIIDKALDKPNCCDCYYLGECEVSIEH